MKKLIEKYDNLCIYLWVKYMIISNSVIEKLSNIIYKQDAKIKDRK